MKLGPVDGSEEEVRGLLENNGLRLQDYLVRPPPPLPTKWVWIPSTIIGITLVALIFFRAAAPDSVKNFLYIIGLGSGIWLTVSIQLRFKNGIATMVVAMGLFILLLVAAGIFSLQEAADFAKDAANSS
jgi:hypothetical protein